MTRTGKVRVRMVDRSVRHVSADSFGEAASKISCGPQEIALFEWVHEVPQA